MTDAPSEPAPAAGPAPAGEPLTSGPAVAGLICGILSVCSMGLTAIPGIILSVVGLRRIARSGGRLRGKGPAVVGLVTSCIGLLVGAALVAMLASLVLSVRQRHGRVEASLRLHTGPQTSERSVRKSLDAMAFQIRAAHEYAEEHGGRLPAAADYPSALEPYVDRRDLPRAPFGRAFAMNAALGGMRPADIDHPDRTILFFEVPEGSPLVGGLAMLRALSDADACVVGFVSGRVEYLTLDALDHLIWHPRSTFIL